MIQYLRGLRPYQIWQFCCELPSLWLHNEAYIPFLSPNFPSHCQFICYFHFKLIPKLYSLPYLFPPTCFLYSQPIVNSIQCCPYTNPVTLPSNTGFGKKGRRKTPGRGRWWRVHCNLSASLAATTLLSQLSAPLITMPSSSPCHQKSRAPAHNHKNWTLGNVPES